MFGDTNASAMVVAIDDTLASSGALGPAWDSHEKLLENIGQLGKYWKALENVGQT